MSLISLKLPKSALALAGVALLATAPQPALAQRDFSKVEIKAEKLADGLHVLFGAGGNIGVLSGDDGVFMVDDQFAPLTDKILTAVKSIRHMTSRCEVRIMKQSFGLPRRVLKGPTENGLRRRSTLALDRPPFAAQQTFGTGAFSSTTSASAPFLSGGRYRKTSAK